MPVGAALVIIKHSRKVKSHTHMKLMSAPNLSKIFTIKIKPSAHAM